MEGFYISNLNASNKILASQQQMTDASIANAERVEDARDLLDQMPVLMTAWNDQSSCPNCSVNYRQLMVCQKSEFDSSIFTNADTPVGQTEIVLPMSSDNLQKVKDFNPKAFVCTGVDGYDKDGSKVCPLQLVLEFVGFDKMSGNPKVKAVNGRRLNPSDENSIVPSIPADGRLVMISDIPEIPDLHSYANVFILGVKCPALREDANKGDMFLYDSSCFYKLYSFQEKIDAIIKEPSKMLRVPDGSSDKCCPVLMTNSLDFKYLYSGIDKFYVLLIEDVEVPKTSVVAAGSGDDASSSSLVTTEFHRRGSFYFVQKKYNEFQLSLHPFDLFFQ